MKPITAHKPLNYRIHGKDITRLQKFFGCIIVIENKDYQDVKTGNLLTIELKMSSN